MRWAWHEGHLCRRRCRGAWLPGRLLHQPGFTDEVVCAVELADAKGLVDACRVARAAQPSWADVPPPVRGRTVVYAGRLVAANADRLARWSPLPFRGNGRSGNSGRLSGAWVLDQVTRWQSVNWDYSGRLQRAQMDVADPSPDLSFRLPEN
ncbi:aldehyde dehydrogenase family protein [Micromonospora sp. NPDC050980]|uniref:aldehyde dehydrogenase family protein n=1 Tax=Micromonospora sp. NPDC050980 TaxID=3155161 RepID=UPI0033F9D175